MASQQQIQQPSGSPVGRAILGFLRFLVRFLFVVMIGALIGWGVYSAVPWFYRNVVQPVQRNTVLVEALGERLEERHARLQEQDLALQQSIADVEARVTTLEGDADVNEQHIQDAAEQIQQLDSRVAGLEKDLEAQEQAVSAVRSALDEAVDDLGGQTDQVAGQTAELEGRLALLQTAQDLLKVRLLLLEGNPRGASDTLALAAVHLDQAMPLLPEQATRLSALQERMVGLEALIAEDSYRVAPELESLWADVMDLVLPAVAQPAEESGS